MNYPSFQVFTPYNGVMTFVKFVPLAPLMTQVVETHMNIQMLSQICLEILKHYLVKKCSILRLFAEISVYPYVSQPLVPEVAQVYIQTEQTNEGKSKQQSSFYIKIPSGQTKTRQQPS